MFTIFQTIIIVFTVALLGLVGWGTKAVRDQLKAAEKESLFSTTVRMAETLIRSAEESAANKGGKHEWVVKRLLEWASRQDVSLDRQDAENIVHGIYNTVKNNW